ncbi:MAG: hypothetical protein M3268_05965, partial [Acidobacteriota bacterium]|nr:hypothetical protein [Acidobacteriota bacterium]
MVKRSLLTTRGWVLLMAAALLVVAGALNFHQRMTRTPPPTDGITWKTTPKGIFAQAVDPNSEAGRAGVLGVQPGDRLVAASLDDEQYDPVTSSSDVPIYLEEAKQSGGRLFYLIFRGGDENRAYKVPLSHLESPSVNTTRDLYINAIGIVYLLVGLFVLFRQGERAPFVTHFFLLC